MSVHINVRLLEACSRSCVGGHMTAARGSRDPCDGYPANKGLGLGALSYVYRPPFPTYVAKRQPRNESVLVTLWSTYATVSYNLFGRTVRRIVHSTLLNLFVKAIIYKYTSINLII